MKIVIEYLVEDEGGQAKRGAANGMADARQDKNNHDNGCTTHPRGPRTRKQSAECRRRDNAEEESSQCASVLKTRNEVEADARDDDRSASRKNQVPPRRSISKTRNKYTETEVNSPRFCTRELG